MEKPLSIKLHKLLLSELPNSSQNLARFARTKKYKELKQHYRIWKSEDGELYIAYKSDNTLICGLKLIRAACGNFDTFAFPVIAEDVTEWFMREYKKKGMCAYTDMRHEWDIKEPDKCLSDESKRVCIHCGKVEILKSKMVRKTWWEELKL